MSHHGLTDQTQRGESITLEPWGRIQLKGVESCATLIEQGYASFADNGDVEITDHGLVAIGALVVLLSPSQLATLVSFARPIVNRGNEEEA